MGKIKGWVISWNNGGEKIWENDNAKINFYDNKQIGDEKATGFFVRIERFGRNPIFKNFTTKKEALQYTYSYMRRYPNGYY